ncbi:MAG: FdtA/QdtA family cupin domain-containing protein [Erysipelotrichaceae bacterium]
MLINEKVKLLSLDSHGNLVVLENEDNNLPFNIKRIFYIFGTNEEAIRGCHANRNSKFLLIAVAGKVNVKVRTKEKEVVYELNNPKEGLYLDRMVWKEMYKFSKDCVLLVISNNKYEKGEYIDDYDQYLKEIYD